MTRQLLLILLVFILFILWCYNIAKPLRGLNMNTNEYAKQIEKMRKQPVPNFGWDRASKSKHHEEQKNKGK